MPNQESAVISDSRLLREQSTWQPSAKRIFDICVAGLVLVLLIKLTSSGPALYVQTRTGQYGQEFKCFKLRTMTYNPQAQFQQATRNDHRVTPLGRILRKTNLDEIPQFLNVLMGEMSIVGPRPHPVPLDIQHWHTMPGYRERYAVRPGITGLAQVRGSRGETSAPFQMEHRVRYDHLYIRRQSLPLDARICWWTFKALFKGNPNAW